MALTNAIVTPRYGAALFALASETKQVDLVQDDLQQLAAVVTATPKLVAALSAPELTPAARQKLLDTLKQGASQLVANLLQMVFDYGRIAALPAIIDDYKQRMQAAAGIVTGTVTTAIALSAEQEAKIASAVAKKLGVQTAQLQSNVDSEIIGGVRVEAANLVIDGTVRTQINKIRAKLLAH
ncbi:MAG: F0F1 ATP synthase subunit delta [Lacticaseibacillus songhuajiangensis]|jgi:F-type H+-transporting ATPase subunit delta|nr:F0F1 ATP synthase subunit delta [Lacticaseibacillus songhuajiangensis]